MKNDRIGKNQKVQLSGRLYEATDQAFVLRNL
jgi:hypothetical protein